MNINKKWSAIAAVGLSVLVLQACGTFHISNNIGDDGHVSKVIFPEITKSTWMKEGTFPNLNNLRNVASGVTKEQLYNLLGSPHFNEGMFNVREWDYVFNFRTANDQVVTCQYKVVFDKKMLGQKFFWLPKMCSDQLSTKSAVTPTLLPSTEADPLVPIVKPVKLVEQHQMQLSGNSLFAFNRSGKSDLLQGGSQELNRIASDLLSGGKIERITVTGHTDRIGKTTYNQQLSEDRAKTIRTYLVDRGIEAGLISAQGVGSSVPLVECKQKQRAMLLACLSQNRRVEINAWIR
jgi:OOP family OmpA-OmpF porin